jgi:hypothetical protein
MVRLVKRSAADPSLMIGSMNRPAPAPVALGFPARLPVNVSLTKVSGEFAVVLLIGP